MEEKEHPTSARKEKDPPYKRITTWIAAVCTIIATLYLIGDHHCNSDKPQEPGNTTININSGNTTVTETVSQGPDETGGQTVKEPAAPTFLPREKQDKKRGEEAAKYTARLMTGAEFEFASAVLLNGKKTKIVGHTQNIIKIEVPALGQSYEIAVVLDGDTLTCTTFSLERNNVEVPLKCRTKK